MSQDLREELLTQIRRLTAAALGRARAGEADAEELDGCLRTRHALFVELDALEGPSTAALRALAHEISMLDRTLIAWCEQKQRGVARSLLKRTRRPINYRASQPRIISQDA